MACERKLIESEATTGFFVLLGTKEKKETLEWCMKANLIASRYECPRFKKNMRLYWFGKSMNAFVVNDLKVNKNRSQVGGCDNFHEFLASIARVYPHTEHDEMQALTCNLKSYPFGLVSLTFEDCLEGDDSFTNPKLEDLRKELHRSFKVKVEKIPIIKRGSTVPLYFTTADERILEYDFTKVIFEDESPYQNVKILHSPTLGNCLILDDLQNLAESDINYTHGVMKFGSISYTGKEVLILGGGDGGLLHELLKENPKFITMVDISFCEKIVLC
ncbi:spermine synthase [Trichonephila clavipes]|nr:spermine synthase [Trichonephila clavipes]